MISKGKLIRRNLKDKQCYDQNDNERQDAQFSKKQNNTAQ